MRKFYICDVSLQNSEMNFIYVILFLFIFLHGINCRNFYQLCPTRTLDRYCALKDKRGSLECAYTYIPPRLFEIAENCFKAMVYKGKNMTINQIIEELCYLGVHEYNAVANCGEVASFLDDNRSGKLIQLSNSCLLLTERKENKICANHYFLTYGDILGLYE
ncbi:uncharacterized protein LOC111638002 [Centruroides sculpturatus]|uniref:uncharacterized protein LOC111638002 n=1 Tax=Centruroides sculpturatus TaxID=218467 RepID=UPI000C6E9EA5|nr:uncharacterized protein LOC111638002 [Centruroides sculpturatus]